jgi:hypothetical protein
MNKNQKISLILNEVKFKANFKFLKLFSYKKNIFKGISWFFFLEEAKNLIKCFSLSKEYIQNILNNKTFKFIRLRKELAECQKLKYLIKLSPKIV